MKQIIIDPAIPQWKGNLHCHTTESDGRLPPQQVAALYERAGYDFLAITDHRRVTDPAGIRTGMLMIPGVELDYAVDRKHRQAVHIIGAGVSPSLMGIPGVLDTPQRGIDAILSFGGRAIFAHPAWSLNDPDLIGELTGLSAVEVYNHMSDDPWTGRRGDSSEVLDLCCADGCCLPFVAGDDAHHYEGEECHSAVIACAPERTQPAILSALRQGNVYASQGPRILDMYVEDGIVFVRCTPAEQILFNTNRVYSRERVQAAHGITEGRYPLREMENFVRVEVADAQGRRAWSSPVKLK